MSTKKSQLIGSVDRFDAPRTIWGWVRDSEHIGQGRDITVRVRRDGRLLAEGPLIGPRRDIVADESYLVGFRLTCNEEISDEAFAMGSISVEAFDQSGRSKQLPIYDRTRSFAWERALLVGQPLGPLSASVLLNCLGRSPSIAKDARHAILELNDKYFEETDRKLVMQFESLGKDCSVGSIQRAFGSEPIGLWRFSGIGIDQVTRALENRLSGIGSPEFTEITKDARGEYYTRDKRYHMSTHTFIFEGNVEFDDFFKKQCKKLTFLVRNLLEKIEAADKILVVHAIPDQIPDTKLQMLYQAIKRIGPSELLYLQLATEEFQPGTVFRRADGILSGYVLQVQGEMMRPEAEVRAGWMQAFRNAQSIISTS